jgi:(4-alkanoyl-5-oxo-2,5-dihydrofuran-3-yl)methyl phosphate reductase
MSRILVTGATGNVGARLVHLLVAAGQPVRAFVLRGESVPASYEGKVEIAVGDLANSEHVRAAVQGVSRMYLLSTGPELARLEATAVKAAAEAGVEYVVKHSVMGAPYEASHIPRWHRAGEKLLEQSSMKWTFLRPASFASNALFWTSTVKGQGKVYGALGEAALPVIDPEDIAAVAAHVLTTQGHEGKAYELTGPESLTTAEQVATLSRVLDRPLTYVNVPDQAALDGMLSARMPKEWAEAMIDLIQMLRGIGRLPATDTVQKLLGRRPHTFREWAAANATAFR